MYFSHHSLYAAVNTWPLTTPTNYTLSDDTITSIQNGIADLDITANQTGSIANNNGPVYLDTPRRVAVSGNYAYVSAYTPDRIQVLDISDPTNPTGVTSLLNNDTTLMLSGPMDLAISGNYLYIAEYIGDAIQVIDISTPAVPTAAGNFPNSGAVRLNGPRGLTIDGNYLYVASFVDDAIQIFDISTPPTLIPVANLRDTTRLNGARDIVVEGNYAYVSARNGDSIQIIDISTPASPSFVGQIVNDGTTVFLDSVWGIDKQGDYIYAAGYNQDRIQIIDVSTPSSPTAVANLSTTELPGLNGPRNVVVDGDFLFVADYLGDSVMIVDISDPTSPLRESEILNSGSTNLNGPREMVRIGDFIYLSSYPDDDFVILETSYDITSPTIIPTTAFNYGSDDLTSFTETLGAENAGSVTYQISKDNGTTWYYWNGSSWQTTTNGVVDSVSASVVNTNIEEFSDLGGGTNQFLWKAFLTSDDSQKVELDEITVVSTPPPPPGPGGVNTNLELWLKADAGTSTTTDGAALTTWNDQSGNGLDATAVTTPDYRNNDTDSANFNPVVDFNGSNDYMRNLANGAYTDSYFLVIVPDNTVDGTASRGVPFGWDCLSGTLSSGTCGLTFAGLALGNFTAAIPDEVMTHAIGSSVNWRSAEGGISSYSNGKPMLIGVNENSSSNGTDIYESGLEVDNTTVNTYQSISTADYGIGRSMDNTYPFYFDGKIAEVINYSSRVSDSDRQKIESYLAIKYGITLNSGTQDYNASDGSTTFWDASSVGGYIYNVFGIGRDDDQQLGQVKSKSVNAESIVMVEAESEGTNFTNSFVDITDKEFLMISNDSGGNTWTATGKPPGYDILTRKWHVEEIGDVGTVTLEFDVGDSDFDVPALSSGTSYYIVYDSDNDNDLSDETPTAMTNTSGNLWEITGLDLIDGQEFTIATEQSSNNIPTDIALSSSSINENVTAGSTIGSFSTTDADPGDTHTYNLVSGVGDTDNTYFSLSGSSLILDHSPDYEIKNNYSVRIQTDDGNGGTYQESFPITINDVVEVLSSSLDFESALNDYKYTVTSGTWNRNTTNPFEGSFSMESNNGGTNNSQSCFEVNHIHSSTGSVDFYYEVSSQNGSDFLHFYLDDVEQQTWSGTVPYTQYTLPNIAPGTHEYKWCYIKDGGGSAGNDNAHIDLITFPSGITDVIPPEITSISFASGSLLPGGNHDIVINYSDADTGIDTTSASITLNQWDGISSWGGDISGSGLGSSTITSTSATYPTNNLDFGKYRYNFSIDDNAGNTSSTGAIEFYIDETEFIIGSGSINIGDVNNTTEVFSGNVDITVRTVGAAFDITMENPTSLSYNIETIGGWNGTNGYGYDLSPFSGTISAASSGTNIGSQVQNININGLKNSYIYTIRFGALVDSEQPAGDYEGNIDFEINFSY